MWELEAAQLAVLVLILAVEFWRTMGDFGGPRWQHLFRRLRRK